MPATRAPTTSTRVTRSASKRAAAALAPTPVSALTGTSCSSEQETASQQPVTTTDMRSVTMEQTPAIDNALPTPQSDLTLATSAATSGAATTTTTSSTDPTTTETKSKRRKTQGGRTSVGKRKSGETKPSRKHRKDSGIAFENDAAKALEIHQEQQQQEPPRLLNLPPELFSMILSFLYPSELTKLATLSKQVYKLVENQHIWKTIQTRNNLPEPKRKYPTTMTLVLAYSDLVCEQCLSLSEMKRGGQYSDRPLPVSLVWNPHHPIHLCLPCRQDYYRDHPVGDAAETNGNQILKGDAQYRYQLPNNLLYSLDYESRISRRNREYYLFDEDDVREMAYDFHGGPVGIAAERRGYVIPRHKKPRPGITPKVRNAKPKPQPASDTAVPSLTLIAPGEEDTSKNSNGSNSHSGVVVRIGGDTAATPIAGLPVEIWHAILRYLHIRDLIVFAGVSKNVLKLVESLPLWKDIWSLCSLPELSPRTAKTYMGMVSRYGESICEICHCFSYPRRNYLADRPLPVLMKKEYSPTRKVWMCLECRNYILMPEGGWMSICNSHDTLSKYEAMEAYGLSKDDMWEIDTCERNPYGRGPLFDEDDVEAFALERHGGHIGIQCAVSNGFPRPRRPPPKPKAIVVPQAKDSSSSDPMEEQK
ncbi:hypothetical protein BGZ73_003815 [Actinomortierella ambigua]|nr:hypothetical protein BGZ73_003815 [Actinomortierella ambigua]